MRLHDIGVACGTDKGTHAYLDVYELLLGNRTIDSLLEVGIQFGNSLRMWQKWMPSTLLLGVDSVDNGVKNFDLIFGNAYSHELMANSLALVGTFDLIIDDGSHLPADQAFFVLHYHKMLSADGLLIVEDVPSPDVIPLLGANLPQDFAWMMIDCRPQSPLPDSILFVAWRKA